MPCARRRVTPDRVKAYLDQSRTYEHFSVEGKLHIVCLHCQSPILVAENLDQEVEKEIAQAGDRLKAMKILQEKAGWEHSHAKINALHYRSPDGHCHNCGMELKSGSLICPRCMAVNLDWNL